MKIGDAEVDVCLVDTNVLSEMLKKDEVCRRVLRRMITDSVILAFSVFTMLEIRRRSGLYDRFFQIFESIPFVVPRTPSDLIAEEIAKYPDPSRVQPLGAVFGPLNDGLFSRPREFFDKVFADPDVAASEDLWRDQWARDALESMLAKKANFPPGPNGYTTGDARRFVELATMEQVIMLDPKWAKRRLRRGALATRAFPSLKFTLYSVFFRLYSNAARVPEDPDALDLLIHSASPYVDLVLTESFQVEMVKKIRAKDPTIVPKEAFRLADVRRWPDQPGPI